MPTKRKAAARMKSASVAAKSAKRVRQAITTATVKPTGDLADVSVAADDVAATQPHGDRLDDLLGDLVAVETRPLDFRSADDPTAQQPTKEKAQAAAFCD